jgi:hypothetical protein
MERSSIIPDWIAFAMIMVVHSSHRLVKEFPILEIPSLSGGAFGCRDGQEKLETPSHPVSLCCPEDGNKDRRDYCNSASINDGLKGRPLSICDEDICGDSLRCYQYQVWDEPTYQGIFKVNNDEPGSIKMIDFANYLTLGETFRFWHYSGKPPPGAAGGDTDAHAPKFRSAAFSAASSENKIA